MSTDTLAAFIKARLAEDEQMAKLAAREGGTWKQDDAERFPGAISSLGGQVVYDEGAPNEYQGAHIARHDPNRALREVDLHRAVLSGNRTVVDWGADDCPRIVLLLAAIWSDHKDYDRSWAPERP